MILIFEKNDITKIEVDAIVNAANNTLLGGGGVDGAIHWAAGPKLLEECKTLGGCETGKAKITKGYNLPSKYVIHTVGPIYNDGKHNEEKMLKSCYVSCLDIAKEYKLKSIAFPLISAGVYGYPKEEAFDVAVKTIKGYFENDDYDIMIKIVLFGQSSYEMGLKKYGKIDEYIDNNYVEEYELRRNGVGKQEISIEYLPKGFEGISKNRLNNYKRSSPTLSKEIGSYNKSNKSQKRVKFKGSDNAVKSVVRKNEDISLDDMIKNIDASFSDTLLKIIDEKKLKDSEVYFRANMDRKLFSKIRNGSHPKKTTAISLCIALKLSYEETNDLLIMAGYILNNSEKFDVIISYFLKKKKYDIYEINEALLHYDQPQLGIV